MKSMIGTMVLALLLAAPMAQAKGRVLSADELSPEVRVKLQEEIARARSTTPDAFKALGALVADADTLDSRKRGRAAPFTSIIKKMGPEVTWAAVEFLAFEAPVEGPQGEVASETLDAALVEAVGFFRNEQLAPVWTAILDGGESRPWVVKAAAASLARLETDQAAQKLVALAKSDGLRQEAALASMGHCRRTQVAQALAAALEANPDLMTLKVIARSLADVGSAAAWKTPAVKHRSEEGAVRRLAAEALVRAYVAHEGEARDAVSDALMVVDSPITPSLIAAARRDASGEQATALDRLGRRFERNPAR
jgi:hypothetical protein